MNSLFNLGHAIYDDRSDKTQRNIQNVEHANYMLNNFSAPNGVGSALDVALDHQQVFVKGTGSMAIGGANVDKHSDLTVNRELLRQRERLNIAPRPFMSIPYMGRGNTDPDVESALLQSGELPEKKSDVRLSERDLTQVRNYPLIDGIQGTISNPQYLVEESADTNWIRGGMASRNLAHQENY